MDSLVNCISKLDRKGWEEWEKLLVLAKEPNVQAIFQDVLKLRPKEKIETTTTINSNTTPAPSSTIPIPAPRKVATIDTAQRDYVTVSGFSWEQEDSFMKVSISLEGVGNLADENIIATFLPDRFDCVVHDLNGKNYKFSLSNLNATINATKSSFIKRSSRIIFKLKKNEQKHWDSIQKRADKIKKPNLEEGADPNKGLMDLMKNMYEEGDDEMKKTIAKA